LSDDVGLAEAQTSIVIRCKPQLTRQLRNPLLSPSLLPCYRMSGSRIELCELCDVEDEEKDFDGDGDRKEEDSPDTEDEVVSFDAYANMKKIIKGRRGPFGEVASKYQLVGELVAAGTEQSFKDCVSKDPVLDSEVAAVGVRFRAKKVHSADALSEMLVELWRAFSTRDLQDKIKDWRQGNKPMRDFIAKMVGVAASARAAVQALDRDTTAEEGKGIFLPYSHGLTGLKPAGKAFPTCPGCGCSGSLELLSTWDEVEAANNAKRAEYRRVQEAFAKDGVGRLGNKVKACPAAQKASDMPIQCSCSRQHCALRPATNKSCATCSAAHAAGTPIPAVVIDGLNQCTCPTCRCNCTTAFNVSALTWSLACVAPSRPTNINYYALCR
jgi:hypothetical protein